MRTLARASELDALAARLGSAIDRVMREVPGKSAAGAHGDTTGEPPGHEAAAAGGWALIGLRRRGDVLARRLADRLGCDRIENRVGSLDITLYRDDLSEVGPQAVVRTTEVDFAIDGLNVVLVDDVLMTGRSVRAALTSLVDLGRPRRVWLAVLVDRGGRELPIAADFVALNLRQGGEGGLEPSEQVQVQLTPADEQDAIVIR